MKTGILITVTLLLLVVAIQKEYSCKPSSNNCCQSSSTCCQSSSTCCQTSSNCCNTCQVRCRTTSCVDQCKSDCCPVKYPKKPTDSEEEQPDKVVSTTTNTQTVINNNSVDFSATINLSNVIHNENRVHVPINITHRNINNVVIIPYPNSGPTPSTDKSVTVTVTVKVPIPVPVPGKNVTVYVPIYYPMPFPLVFPRQIATPGCCVTITPCTTDYCNPYNRMCGGECSHHYMYRPINPCENGCYRRQYSSRKSCYGSGYCQTNLFDCSRCNENFYLNYENYRQCGSCFYS